MYDLFVTVCQFLAVVFIAWALIYLSVLIHEMGHVIGAMLVGWTPYTMVVGTGKERKLFRIGYLRLKWGLNPFGGLTRAVPSNPKAFRAKYIFLVLLGPSATALYAFLLYLVIDAYEGTRGADAWLPLVHILLFWEIITLLSNLLPREFVRSGEKMETDGLKTWRLIRSTPSELTMRFNAAILVYTKLLIEEKNWIQARLILRRVDGALNSTEVEFASWTHVLLLLGYKNEAESNIEELIKDTNKADSEKAAFLDGVACLPLYADHPAFLPMAARCIDEAIRLTPEAITLKGTKASILIEQNDLDVGISMLEQVKAQSKSENDQGICSFYLAYATSKKGDAAAALKELRWCKEKYPTCVVKGRVESKIMNPGSS